MRILDLLAAILLGSLACQSDQGALQSSSVAECHHAGGLDDAGPGACTVGRAYLQCSYPSGTQCLCVTNDQSCEGCGPGSGATCQNQCRSNEYAVSCGGPPKPDASFAYADPPAGCRSLGFTPGGSGFYCCPCL